MHSHLIGAILLVSTSVSTASDFPEPVIRVTEITTTTGPLPAPMSVESTNATPCNDASGGPSFFEYYGNCHANLGSYLLYPLGGASVEEDGNIRTRMVCDDISYTTAGFPPYFSGYIVNGVTAGFGVINSVGATIGIRYMFYDSDGPDGGPGTLLWGFGIAHPFSHTSGQYYALLETHWPVLSPPIWSLHPRSASPMIWGCYQFDNLGDPAADVDFMNRLSVLEYDGTPRFGSSQGMHFTSTSSNDSSCTDRPRGTLTTSPGASFFRHLLFDDPRNLNVDVLWQDSFDWSGNGCGIPWHSQ
jgi:hypothetical protein